MRIKERRTVERRATALVKYTLRQWSRETRATSQEEVFANPRPPPFCLPGPVVDECSKDSDCDGSKVCEHTSSSGHKTCGE